MLEINSGHPIFETLKKVASDDPEKLREYAYILYNQSLLIDGLSIEDPVEFSNKICGLMSEKSLIFFKVRKLNQEPVCFARKL